ncbi:HAMP domain-containing sensor histidine kinase [Geobacter benzoatilyticus]|uniref:histidine kinase n=1 Tax=Geobacter benzoatilyticus TaxID=2815309 RepID=A0ABX7Q245_9BACT|nr:HAMP domain-containing sensor histidine kinase [Geobacter benzoatilyticus]QSV45493.1 HAMP domain-containing protein [Geobacter benzoatilyticus]
MMRRLYFKILLHWVVALIVTEALIFGLFLFIVKDGHRAYVVESIGRNTLIARDYVEAAIAGCPVKGEDVGTVMRDAVERLGASAHAKVWINRTDGTLLAASFAGDIKVPEVDSGKSANYEKATINVEVGPKRLSYSTVPITLGNPLEGTATLHILTEREPGRFPHGKFGAGLALIGVVIAVFAIPLSRHITRPLKRLQESALRIAGGDLSARADIRGKDEIGRLGQAFNSMAETVERMIQAGKELTANVSHELRSPLARIRVAGECLKDSVARGDTSDSAELLEGMWEDIAEADQLIGRILDYSKLDLHEPVPVTTEVWPATILDGLLKAMRPQFKTKEITVEIEVEPQLSVAGDEEWLRAAFKNLLENAARYTSEGGRVRISMRSENDAVMLEVTNSSPPLLAEDLERIFNPFYRGKGATGEGTGLGLAITKKIIALHQGDIGARNTPQGFQVWLRLSRFTAEGSVLISGRSD